MDRPYQLNNKSIISAQTDEVGLRYRVPKFGVFTKIWNFWLHYFLFNFDFLKNGKRYRGDLFTIHIIDDGLSNNSTHHCTRVTSYSLPFSERLFSYIGLPMSPFFKQVRRSYAQWPFCGRMTRSCVALTIVESDKANCFYCDGLTFVSPLAVVALHKTIDSLLQLIRSSLLI